MLLQNLLLIIVIDLTFFMNCFDSYFSNHPCPLCTTPTACASHSTHLPGPPMLHLWAYHPTMHLPSSHFCSKCRIPPASPTLAIDQRGRFNLAFTRPFVRTLFPFLPAPVLHSKIMVSMTKMKQLRPVDSSHNPVHTQDSVESRLYPATDTTSENDQRPNLEGTDTRC